MPDEVCKRCGMPSPESDLSASEGGVTLVERPTGTYCAACDDYLKEVGQSP